MPDKSSVVIYGPQGCGKTRNAKLLAKHFELKKIHDNWFIGDYVDKNNTLILTNETPEDVRVTTRRLWISFDAAMKATGKS